MTNVLTDIRQDERRHLPFFVYGSLRPGLHNYPHFIGPIPHTVEPAIFKGGFLFDNNKAFPYLVALGEEEIVGELVRFGETQFESVLKDMDRLEGYNGPNDPHNHYERRIVTVTGQFYGETEAYVYVVPESDIHDIALGLPLVESGDWLEYMFKG